MSEKPFQLRIVPRENGDYGVALFQKQIGQGDKATRRQDDSPRVPLSPRPLITVWGTPLRAATDQLLDALKRNGYRATDLSRTRKAPFALDEESGVRLGLLLVAVKPLRKLTRIEAISAALRSMAAEEVYYWFSKCTAGESLRRAQRALRILLAEE
jgi:hypothetical protein